MSAFLTSRLEDPEQDGRKHSDFDLVLIPPFNAVFIYRSEIFEILFILVDSKPVYYKHTMESQHLIFWPSSQKKVHEHTAQLKPNLRILINHISYNPITVDPSEVRAFLGVDDEQRHGVQSIKGATYS
jgi:hypothetical protein